MNNALSQEPFDLFIPQGADFNITFQLTSQDTDTPLDLTNYTWKGQLRTYYTSKPFTSFTIVSLAPFNQGRVSVSLSANQTNSLNTTNYLYDIFGTDTTTNITQRFLFGIAKVSLKVTQ